MICYIDFENVQSAGMNGIEQLDEKDRLCIFYSESKCRLTFSLMQKILSSKAEVEFAEVTVTAPNALDFQLSTRLGYDIARFPEEKFFIISNDKGYRSAIAYWQERSVKVFICADVRSAAKYDEKPAAEAAAEIESSYAVMDDVKRLSNILSKQKSKQHVHTALMKEFGGQKATALYRAVKDIINTDRASKRDVLEDAVRTAGEQISAEAAEQAKEVSAERTEEKAVSEVPAENESSPDIIPAVQEEAKEDIPAKKSPEKAPSKKASGKASAKKTPEKIPAKKKSGRPKKQDTPVLSELIPRYSGDAERVEEIISKYKTKLGISKALLREYGSAKAEKIYGLITPLIKDKKGKDISGTADK